MKNRYAHADDRSTWQAMKAGDAAAFEYIYRTHIQALYRYGYSFHADEAVVVDSIHDLFSNIWQKRERLGDTDSIKFYLFKSLKNRLIRHTRRERILPYADFVPVATLLPDDAPDESALTTLHQKLDLHLGELSVRQQEIIRLRFYENLPHEQIAELMQMNPQSAKNLLHRAILALRKHFVAIAAATVSALLA